MPNKITATVVLSGKETISAALGSARRGVEAFKKSMGDAHAAMQLGNEHAKKYRDTIGKFGKGAVSFGKKVTTGVTLPVIGAAGLATKAFADFDNSMRAVENEMSEDAFGVGKFKEGMAGMRKGMLEFSKTTPLAMGQLSAAMQELVSAGVPAREALNSLRASERLAVSSGTDLKTTTDGLVGAMNSFNVDAEKSGLVAGKFFIAAKAGAVSVADLSENMGRIGVTARNAGISMDEMLAAVATATNGGIKGGEAFGAMEQILKAISKPSEDAKKGAKLLGVEWSKSALKAKGFTQFIGEIVQKADKLGVDRSQVFETMFGAGKGKDALAMVQVMLERQDEYKSTLKQINSEQENTNQLNAAYEKQVGSTTNQILIAKNEVQALATEMGEKLAPAVVKGVELFRGFMRFMSEHPTIAMFSAGLAAVAAVMGPVILVFGHMLAMAPAIISGFTAVTTLFAGLTAAAFALPVAIGAAVVGLGAAAYQIYKHWEPIKSFFNELWDGIIEKFNSFLGLFDKAPSWFKNMGSLLGPTAAFGSAGGVSMGGGMQRDRVAPTYGAEMKVSKSTIAPGAAGTQTNNAHVTIDFKNPPPGTRTKVSKDSAGMVDFSRGNQGGYAP